MIPIPLHPHEKSAVITRTPGVRKSTYESADPNPGISATFLKRALNRKSQMNGWTMVMARNHGWRMKARTWRPVMT